MSTKDSRYRVGWDVLYPPLISPNPAPAGKKTITQNGTNIDIAQYATADISVQPNVDSKEITSNGDYIASNENLDGYSSVHVAVPSSATGTIEITQNGITNVSSYANADVEVPPPSFMRNPIVFDYNKGYVDKTAQDNLGIFVYQDPTNCYSDIYTVENGKTYRIMYGETVSTRARGCLTQTDVRTLQPGESTSGEATMVGVYSGTINPGGSWSFTAPFDGYFIMQKTNYGVTGLLTYLYCIDDMNAAVPSGTKNITENGQGINVAGYSAVNVSVPGSELGTKTINVNGTYNASSDSLDGYSQVIVETPVPMGKKVVQSNGQNIDIAQYAWLDVNVPSGASGTIDITENGSVDVSTYATANVAVTKYLSFRDRVLIPDKYNTGCHGYLEAFDLTNDTSGLLWQESGNDLKLDFNTSTKQTIYGVDTSHPIIYKDINFTQYEKIVIANANMCSKSDQYYKAGVIIVFENCLFRQFDSAYPFSASDIIQFVFINCTFEKFKISNSYVLRCLFGNKTFYKNVFGDELVDDAIKLFSYTYIINSYVMDVEPKVTTAGSSHYDGLQFTDDVDQTTLFNVRFECMDMPYDPSGGGWSYSIFYQGQATNSVIVNCIIHGGGYYETSISKSSSLILANNIIADGYSTPCYPGDDKYQLTDEGLSSYNNLYVSSIFCDGKEISIVCTNDYSSAKTLTVKLYSVDELTSTTKTFSIPACPSRDNGWSGITDWDDLPFDKIYKITDIEAFNISKIECYDDNTLIRTWYYEISEMPIDISSYLTITANGTYNTEDKAGVIVNVPTSVSGTIQIAQNGTGIDVGQYQYADVAVPQPSGTINISTDGTYDVSSYATAVVSTGGGRLPSDMEVVNVNVTSDVADLSVPYDGTKSVAMVFVIPDALQGTAYEITFIMGKMNFYTGDFDQYYGTLFNYNYSGEQPYQNTNIGSMSFDSANNTLTIHGRGGNYKFKSGDTFRVLIVYGGIN